MKERPPGFLAQRNIDHDSEVFDYIRELHDYLWRFIRASLGGGCSGSVRDYIDKAVEKTERVVHQEGGNMKIVVEFELKESLSRLERKKLRILLLDALYEFRAHREPAAVYVEKRYPGNAYQWLDREEKVAQVNNRNRIAKALSHGLKTISIVEEV